ncbi:MAG: hypothetical protein AB1582_12120 [Pseudomonadota bacterium]
MNCNVIDFQSKVDARRVSDVSENPSEHEYVLELEHEILELQQQVCALHRDLERERRPCLRECRYRIARAVIDCFLTAAEPLAFQSYRTIFRFR